MYKVLLFTALLFSLLIGSSCTPQGEPPGEQTDPTSTEGTQESEPPNGTVEIPDVLPFNLYVNDIEVGADRTVSVPEDQVTMISIFTNDMIIGSLMVARDGSDSVPLGEWQSDQAQFIHSFQYGENHLLITLDHVLYDILVVAGAPEPDAGTKGCSDTFMDLSLDTRLVFEESGDDTAPARWDHYVTNISTDSMGNSAVTYIMERSSGIEGNISHAVTLDLICNGETIYITGASELVEGTVWSTEYDENTLYLPPGMSPGTTWERHGNFDADLGDEVVRYSLVERLRCTGQDRISVTAGEFDAYRVDYTTEKYNDEESFTNSGTSWYVPGLGRVLTESRARLEMMTYEGIAPSHQ